MATPTTDAETIRENMIAVVKALTPAVSVPGSAGKTRPPFVVAKDELDFRLWAKAHSPGSFRHFTVIEVTDHEIPAVSNTAVEFLRASFRLLMAFPKAPGRYGPKNLRDLESLADVDMHQIDSALGIRGAGNYVSGQCASWAASKRLDRGEDADSVMFLEMLFLSHFYRGF